MTIKHLVMYRNSDGHICSQNISIAELSQSVSSPPVGYSWLDISASTYAGRVVDEKTVMVDAGGCLCREMTSTEWAVANAPTWMHLKPIISNELVASDHTQLSDASTAGHGSTSKSDWANYRQTLRTFTSTMDPYDILATWPTKPNDGSTAYDQYFDPIADLIARTTARKYPVRVMHASALQFNYRGGNDTSPKMRRATGFFTIPPSAAIGGVGMSGAAGSYRASGNDAASDLARKLSLQTGSLTIAGSTAMLTHPDPSMTAGTGYFSMSGKDAITAAGHRISVSAGMYATTGKDASVGSTYVQASYGAWPDSGQFTFTGSTNSMST